MHSQISQQFRKGKSLIGGIVLIFILALTVTQAIQSQMAAAQSGPGRVDSPQVSPLPGRSTSRGS